MSENGISAKKRSVFILITVALLCLLLEGASFIIWKMLVGEQSRNNVRALCGADFNKPEKLPNTFWHHSLNPDHKTYKGVVNPKGTKGESFELPKPEGEFRVVCVGDSTVEGTGVSPHETFPYYLEEKLQTSLDLLPGFKSVRVINAGVGSHNSAFNLAYLANRLIHFQPDLVVIKSSYNDYLPYCIPGMGLDYSHAFPDPFHRYTSSNPYWIPARYSYFLKLLGTKLFHAEVNVPFRDFSGVLTQEQFQKMDFSGNRDKFFVYGENIRSMILLCKGRGIDVIVLDLPTSPAPEHFGEDRTFGLRFKGLINRLEEELKRITGEEDVTYVITGPFRRHDFWDHCHNTADGNEKIAKRLAEKILAQKEISRNKP